MGSSSRLFTTERLSRAPSSFYFVDGKVKVELAMARGRKMAEKRHAMADPMRSATWRE